MRSNSGQLCMNSRYSRSVQKPITRSTPARLYQLRSKSTISPAAGRCGNVALEVPLRLLALCRRAQGHDAADARIERLGDALDGAALAGGVAALEEHHDAQAFVANPLLQLDQLDLQAAAAPARICSPCPGAWEPRGGYRCRSRGHCRSDSHCRNNGRCRSPDCDVSSSSPPWYSSGISCGRAQLRLRTQYHSAYRQSATER